MSKNKGTGSKIRNNTRKNNTKKPPKIKVNIKEKDFLRSLVTALRYKGIYVQRQNVIRGHFKNSNNYTSYLSSGIPDGCTDLLAVFPIYGISVWIECKGSNGKVRDTQLLFKEEIESLGGIYYLATPNQPLQKTLEDLHSLVRQKCEEIANKFAFKLT